MEQAPNGREKVTVKLIGESGNSFAILGRAVGAMKKAGWSPAEINEFRDRATRGTYDELLTTILEYARDVTEVD